jgi:DNA-binding MarR family transcriptional regulator
MLPIRQHLLTLTCLKSTAKTVLVEVCELAENGKKGGCFVSNATLARDLGISLATATRTVASLVEAGLLTSYVVKAEANRRYLCPTPRLRACYVGGTEAQQLAAAATLTIVKTESETELTIVKTDSDYSQNASRVLGDDQYDQVDDQHDQRLTPSERAVYEKKIGDLQAEILHLKARLARKAPPVADAPPAGYRDFEGDWPPNLTPPFAPPAFRTAWATYADYAAEIGKPFGPISEKQALTELGRFAAGDMQRALRILSHNITQRYRTLTNDDGTQSARKPSNSGPGTAGPGRVEALPAGSYCRNRGATSPAAEPAASVAA